MKSVRIGVVGLGSAGERYARILADGSIRGATLDAVCTRTDAKLAPYRKRMPVFTDSGELIRSGAVDAVLIATPHFDHVPTGIAALTQGLHVLMDKPIAVQLAEGQRLLKAHTKREQVFAVMFNLRTDPHYVRIRDMVRSGELGRILRIGWTFTEWYRPQSYFNESSWRGTWAGEGGGLLVNQMPHHLDLLQWIFGMPLRVSAFVQNGKYHQIEVEDEVTAHLEFPERATASLVFSTGEAPGVNRLEIVADKGTLVFENGKLVHTRIHPPLSEHTLKAPQDSRPKSNISEVTVRGTGGQHAAIIQNFVDAIRDGAPLVAPAKEALASIEISNAMTMSAHIERPVTLPLSPQAYAQFFDELMRRHSS